MKFVESLLHQTNYLEILDSLEQKEETRMFCRHGFEHLLDVARIAYILNLEKNWQLEKEMIYLTALLHDSGRLDSYKIPDLDHALCSLTYAKKWLDEIGYPKAKSEMILYAIGKHRHANHNEADNLLLSAIKTADHLSRSCFRCKAEPECYWSAERKNKTILY